MLLYLLLLFFTAADVVTVFVVVFTDVAFAVVLLYISATHLFSCVVGVQ